MSIKLRYIRLSVGPHAASSSKPGSFDISAGVYFSDVFLGNSAVLVINICSCIICRPVYTSVQMVFTTRRRATSASVNTHTNHGVVFRICAVVLCIWSGIVASPGGGAIG